MTRRGDNIALLHSENLSLACQAHRYYTGRIESTSMLLKPVREVRVLERTAHKFSIGDLEFLSHYASRYIWWKTEEESLAMPSRLIAQIMNIGTLEDMNAIAEHFGDNLLCDIIRNAEIGQFREKSWTYWNYRLGLADIDHMPTMPERRVPTTTNV